MADKPDQSPLPDYENPPVVETVLGVQFDRLPKLTNGQLGAFWQSIDASAWPIVADAPLLPTQYERFGKAGAWERALQVQFTQDPACRLRITNADGDRMIQVQNSRLHLNWLGKDVTQYPRYEKTIKPEFAGILKRFQEFVVAEGLGAFRPNQWEVTYVNQIPRGTLWETPADWGFFQPLSAVPTIESVIEGESFRGEWRFVIPQQRGRLRAEWQYGKSAADENDSEENEFIRLSLTARGPIEEGDDGDKLILDGIDLGHETIVRSFCMLMSDKANQYWGLNNGT